MSVFVTDTHPLLWFATERHAKLSRKALRAFERATRHETLIWVPAMVIWEAGLLQRLGRIHFKQSIRNWADALTAQPGFALAPVDLDVVYASLDCRPNSDLFDIAIVATAMLKGLPLITKDEEIVRSGVVEILW